MNTALKILLGIVGFVITGIATFFVVQNIHTQTFNVQIFKEKDTPATLSGVWKSGERGFISSEVILVLSEDGGATLNASSMFVGLQGTMLWSYKDGYITFKDLRGVEERIK